MRLDSTGTSQLGRCHRGRAAIEHIGNTHMSVLTHTDTETDRHTNKYTYINPEDITQSQSPAGVVVAYCIMTAACISLLDQAIDSSQEVMIKGFSILPLCVSANENWSP